MQSTFETLTKGEIAQNCNYCFLINVFNFLLILPLFTEISYDFVNMFSKSSAADLLYTGKSIAGPVRRLIHTYIQQQQDEETTTM